MIVDTVCFKCEGKGRINKKFLFFSYRKTCPVCKGKGQIIKKINENKLT